MTRELRDGESPYDGIPSITERAMRRRQWENARQGQRAVDVLNAATSAISVDRHQTTHDVTSGEHEHLHQSDETGQVFHIHRHPHHNDALHNPHPGFPGPEHGPGRAE